MLFLSAKRMQACIKRFVEKAAMCEHSPYFPQSHGGGSDDCSSLSNTWILSAADTCANMANDGGSWPSTFVFPESLRGTELEGDTDDWLRMDQGEMR